MDGGLRQNLGIHSCVCPYTPQSALTLTTVVIHAYYPPLPPSPFFQVATWQEKMEVFNVNMGNMGNVGKGGKGGKGVKGVKGVKGKDDKCMIM